jgi:hypothetical protein
MQVVDVVLGVGTGGEPSAGAPVPQVGRDRQAGPAPPRTELPAQGSRQAGQEPIGRAGIQAVRRAGRTGPVKARESVRYVLRRTRPDG